MSPHGSDRGGLQCSPYATYGTEALAVHVVNTLGHDGAACLMGNHGAIAVATDLDSAMALAIDIEWFCGVFRRASQLGDPLVLDPGEIANVAALFNRYGQPADGSERHGS